MSDRNLVIYKFKELYQILEEVGLNLNFKITYVDKDNYLSDFVKNHTNYLVISNKKYLAIHNQFVLDYSPINIFKLDQ